MTAIVRNRRGPMMGVVVGLVAVVLAVALLAGCSSDSGNAAAQTNGAAVQNQAGGGSAAVFEFDPPTFKPAAAIISDGGTVTVAIMGGGCDLTVDGKSAGRLLLPGDRYTWPLTGKGDHRVSCKDQDTANATVTVK